MAESREWQLVRRPVGVPAPEDFALVTKELPAPTAGQVLVANTFLSVDPYMRSRMNDAKSYIPAFELDAPMLGAAVGRVVESADARDVTGRPIAVGDVVLHDDGWRTHAVLDGAGCRVVDAERAPEQAYLGVLGMPGLTAYAGLLRVGEFREGDRVFVNAAGGVVGSLVGQIARLKGASRVVGSAGGAEKVAWLQEQARYDAAFDYKAMPFPMGLKRTMPEGIDVFFDNVGGEQLQTGLSNMRDLGRIVICGAISGYNATEPPPGPRNLALLITRQLMMRGFVVFSQSDLFPDFLREVGGWIAAGEVVYTETISDGIESAYQQFTDMMAGRTIGKALIRI